MKQYTQSLTNRTVEQIEKKCKKERNKKIAYQKEEGKKPDDMLRTVTKIYVQCQKEAKTKNMHVNMICFSVLDMLKTSRMCKAESEEWWRDDGKNVLSFFRD